MNDDSEVFAIFKAIWAYRLVIILAFIVLSGLDLVLRGLQSLVLEGCIFILGVFVGISFSHKK